MRTAPIPFAGSQLGEVRHVCAFFNSEDEKYRVLLPFIKDGFECGDKAVHVVNPDQRHDHLERLAAAGIDTDGRRGERSTRAADQRRNVPSGRPLRSGPDARGVRASGNRQRQSRLSPQSHCMPHGLGGDGRSHVEDLVEFESRVNDVWSRHDDAVICVYDLAKFGGDTVVDIMRTHPMIIIGGILQQNPFFVPPGEFLREFRGRRTR